MSEERLMDWVMGNPYQIMLVSLWTELWHYGLGVVLIVLFGAAAWFSPVFKSTFLWLAVAVAVALGGYTVGIKNASQRCAAQATALDNAVKKVVKSTTTKRGRAWKDPYDRKDF